MKYKIMGKYNGRKWEVVDTASSRAEAYRLMVEYNIAFGPDWRLAIKCGGEWIDEI